MAYLLEALPTKAAIDDAIRGTKDKVLVLRFGRSSDAVCLQMDDILARCEVELSKMAQVYTVDTDNVDVEIYCQYFDVSLIPSTIFFFNGQHMKVDFGTPDNTKFVGALYTKQDCIDLVEVIFRGAMHGKYIVLSPIPHERIPQYELLYKDF
ncbi:thioredoxin-like protein 4B [Saprolegnia parasitica CBS 223.65]|uniref:Thioredoxin-like protein 4B n=1 Tax=Saprolegnia parasitica (strain CBS 223.65) TaxID=695850 RepID=A0A067BV25_SAPPC|nr:thioredoxin-like protein 4B [Saprolegnia parasitica CBS 223.65]KDO22123.1 thioredoxin-like protein 4B [Saprolegnia parasitica CBS 223.65]|eukprot:XP_012207162.1 thioredoxin-like protein 4B [Saprolegnia parasitica CBS 223.65]